MLGIDFSNLELAELAPYLGAAVGLLMAVLVLWLGMRRSGAQGAGNPFDHAKPPGQTGANPAAPDPFVHGAKRERRSALRRSGNPVAVLISNAEARSEPTHGWVVDRSTGGLCVTVAEPVAEGAVVSVRTTNAPSSIPWVQLEVKNCRAVGKEYELGCRFVRTPPWSVMLLFG